METQLTQNSEAFHRGRGLFDPVLLGEDVVTIVGCGGIGSWLALALAKLGAKNFRLIDNDEIESVNLGGQIYGRRHLGSNKTQALKSILLDLAPQRINVEIQEERITEPLQNQKYLFSAVDNMSTRSILYLSALEGSRFFFDGRIGGNIIRAYAIDMQKERERTQYAATLYSDDESSPLPCTEQNVAYLGFTIAGMLATLFTQAVSGARKPWEIQHQATMFQSLPSILG